MGRLESARRLGVLGGTFDPIHVAHLRIAAAARNALRLDLVLFMPTGDPWRKHDRPVTPAHHRLAMVQAAVAEIDGCAVTDLEVRRAGPTYSVDTVEALRAQGHQEIWLIVGADVLLDLPHWREPERLVSLVRFALLRRPGYELSDAQLNTLVPGLGSAVDWVPMAPVDLSATQLRALLAAGDDVADRVPAAALAYIRTHGLYQAPVQAGS